MKNRLSKSRLFLSALLLSTGVLTSVCHADGPLVYFGAETAGTPRRMLISAPENRNEFEALDLSLIQKLCTLDHRASCDGDGFLAFLNLGFKDLAQHASRALADPLQNIARLVQEPPKRDQGATVLMSFEVDPITGTVILFVSASVYEGLSALEKATLNWVAHLYIEFGRKTKKSELEKVNGLIVSALNATMPMRAWTNYGEVYRTLIGLDWAEWFGFRMKNEHPDSWPVYLESRDGELACLQLQNVELFLEETPCRGWIPVSNIGMNEYRVQVDLSPFKALVAKDLEFEVVSAPGQSLLGGILSKKARGFNLQAGVKRGTHRLLLRSISTGFEIAEPVIEYKSKNEINLRDGTIKNLTGTTGLHFQIDGGPKMDLPAVNQIEFESLAFGRDNPDQNWQMKSIEVLNNGAWDHPTEIHVSGGIYKVHEEYGAGSFRDGNKLYLKKAEWPSQKPIVTSGVSFVCKEDALGVFGNGDYGVDLVWSNGNSEPAVSRVNCNQVQSLDFPDNHLPEFVSGLLDDALKSGNLKIQFDGTDDIKFSGVKAASEAQPFEYSVPGDLTIIEKHPVPFWLGKSERGLFFNTTNSSQDHRDAEIRDYRGRVNLISIQKQEISRYSQDSGPAILETRFVLLGGEGLLARKLIHFRLGENLLVPRYERNRHYSRNFFGKLWNDLRPPNRTAEIGLSSSESGEGVWIGSEDGFKRGRLLCESGRKVQLAEPHVLDAITFKKISGVWTAQHDLCK